MNRLSLRTRLVALAVVLVAIAVLATGAATYVALQSYLGDELDEELQGVVSRPSLTICADDLGRQPPAGPPFAAALLAPDGSRQIDCGLSPRLAMELDLDPGQVATLLAGRSRPVTMGTPGGEFRVVRYDSRIGPVAVGVSTEDLEATLGRLLVLELVIGTVAFLPGRRIATHHVA